MKIRIAFFILPILACACATSSPEEGRISGEDSLANETEFTIETTEYDYPTVALPNGFYMDSIVTYDSVSKASYQAFFLQSNLDGLAAFNEASRQFVEDQINYEQSFLEPYQGNSMSSVIFSYLLKPTEIYLDSQIISISNMIDTYTEGGAHHNYTLYSFNYDLNVNESIEFDDVFSIQSKDDSTDFITYAEQYSDGCNGWGNPYDNLDFSFDEDGIYINPNLGWACTSTRSLVPIDADNRFLKDKWSFK